MIFDEFPSQIDENACQNLLGAADMLTAVVRWPREWITYVLWTY